MKQDSQQQVVQILIHTNIIFSGIKMLLKFIIRTVVWRTLNERKGNIRKKLLSCRYSKADHLIFTQLSGSNCFKTEMELINRKKRKEITYSGNPSLRLASNLICLKNNFYLKQITIQPFNRPVRPLFCIAQ